MDYKTSLKNNHGATLIYILAAFMIISFIGVTMIKQSHHEMTSSADYSSMKTAEDAARSGIEATEMFFNGNSDSTLKLLQKYINDKQTNWILGDTTTSNRISISNGLSYASELMAFSYDTTSNDSLIVTVKSYGFGKDHTQNTIITFISLEGLEWISYPDTHTIEFPAFKLSGNTDFESNCNITITGFAVANGKFDINGQDFTVNGNFYQAAVSGAQNEINGGTLTFNGKFYSAIPWGLTAGNNLIFNGSAGFDGGVIFVGNTITFNGTIYHNGQTTSFGGSPTMSFMNGWGYSDMDVNGNDIHSVRSNNNYNGDDYLNEMCNNKGNEYEYASPMNIPQLLDMEDLPPDITVDLSVLNSVTPRICNGGWSAADLDNAYIDAVNDGDTLCGGFMVLKTGSGLDPNEQILDGNGTIGTVSALSGLNTRAIIFWDGTGEIANMPECNSTANIVIISRSNNSSKRFGGMDYMRGVLFVEGDGFQFMPENPTTIDGATYYALGARHYNNSGVGIHYKYNSTVLEEIKCMNLFDDGTTVEMIYTDSLSISAPITSTRLSMHL